MLVCFDATVLCGALRRPTGLNFRLLKLAADGVVIDGFTTEVAGTEFVRNALDGLAGIRFTIDEIEEFLDGFGALFDPTTRLQVADRQPRLQLLYSPFLSPADCRDPVGLGRSQGSCDGVSSGSIPSATEGNSTALRTAS